MREFKYKKIRDAFARGASHLSQPAYDIPVYLTHRRAFNPTSLIVSIIATLLVCGVLTSQREFFIISISFAVLFYLLSVRTKKVAQGIFFRRYVPRRGNAGDEISISLDVSNSSPFAVTELRIHDNFLGSTNPPEEFYISRIEAFSTYRLTYKTKLDAGTGFFSFDPIRAIVSDSLNLTEGEVVDSTQDHKIEVFPKIQNLPEIPLQASQNSVHYGIFDVQSPSISVNFMGVRDYVVGDSLKHISWKISARNQNLVVKEFEKSVNVEITILLDMEARKHAGTKAASTWEVAKDLGLSLIAQQVAKGNSVQVLSQNFYLPPGRGEAQSNYAVLSLGQLRPSECETPLLRQAIPYLNKSSVIFYITPCFISDFEAEVELLAKLRAEGHDVYTFLIEPNSYLHSNIFSINSSLLIANDRAIADKKDIQLIKNLAKHEIKTYWIEKEKGIAASLLNEKSTELFA